LIDDDLPLSSVQPSASEVTAPMAAIGTGSGGGERRTGRASALSVAGVLALVLGAVLLITSAGGAEDTTAQSASPMGAPNAGTQDGVRAEPLLTPGTRLAEVSCDLPELSAGKEALRAFYEAEINCLERAWRPVIEQTGAQFTEVGLRLSDDAVTECGVLPPSTKVTALYCGVGQVIYLPITRVLDGLELDRSAHLATLAHEYAHHVQRMSGIMDRVNSELDTFEAGTPGDLELGRRFELQANCFAGLFLASAAGQGSISEADAQTAVEDFHNWADSDTHGTRENQADWARKGFEEGMTSACDTRSASVAEVG
jgi:predicted metalloprotease